MPLLRRPSSALPARRALPLAALLSATVLLSACTAQQGSQSSDLPGTKGDVQAAVQKLADRAGDKNATAICRDLLTAELRATFERRGGCPEAVSAAIAQADYTSLDVVDVRLNTLANATRAEAIVKTVEKDERRRQITLERADPKAPWLIAAFSPKVTATTPASTTPAETTPASTPTTTGN